MTTAAKLGAAKTHTARYESFLQKVRRQSQAAAEYIQQNPCRRKMRIVYIILLVAVLVSMICLIGLGWVLFSGIVYLLKNKLPIAVFILNPEVWNVLPDCFESDLLN